MMKVGGRKGSSVISVCHFVEGIEKLVDLIQWTGTRSQIALLYQFHDSGKAFLKKLGTLPIKVSYRSIDLVQLTSCDE